jgi:hypothetical protein
LRIYSAPHEHRLRIDSILSGFGAAFTCSIQHRQPRSICIKADFAASEEQVAPLVSSLAKLTNIFELETTECYEPARYLFVSGLGIHRQMIDHAGEILVRISSIESAVVNSASDFRELQRQLRLLSGQAHLDIIDSYRNDDQGVVSLAV